MMHDSGCCAKSLRANSLRSVSHRLPTQADCLCDWVAEVGMEERFTAALRLGPRPVDDLGEDPGALQDTAPSLFPGAPNSSQGEGQDRIFLPCPPHEHTPPAVGWMTD